MIEIRWPDSKVRCPKCGSENVTYLENARLWKCYQKHPKAKFSLKVGTIFEDSPLGLDKWLTAVWLVINCKNGISSYEIHRALGITQKSAWFMAHRIRLALQSGSLMKMGGNGGAVEVDETYIGGKARNMHKDRKERMIDGRGTAGKVAVMGLLERHPEKGKSRVRLSTVPTTSRENLQPIIRKNVEPGTEIYTDSHSAYEGMDEYFHEFVNHAETYARGKVHTNGLENFWSLLKRGLRGTYVSVEPFHLFRYLDEQSFRYNNRIDMDDSQRFVKAMKKIVGKRITYSKLTGKEGETTVF
jgi:transposase-like protein